MARDEKFRILWIGDAVVTTGFARVNHSVLEHFDKDFYEIHHLGINYYGDPHDYEHKIYPAALRGDVWGFGRLPDLVRELRPHAIFILNDPWVIAKYLEILRENEIDDVPIVVYFPVDAEEHDPVWYAGYDRVERICVYTDFGKRVVEETGSVPEDKLEVIPHGIDVNTFYELEDYVNKNGDVIKTGEQLARESLYPLKQKPYLSDAFIILNANRNQPRKRIDITCKAFGEFAKDKNDVFLYLHMGNKDAGYDIMKLAHRYNFDEQLILSTTDTHMPNIPDERLNAIYNATTIGLNTGMGEGWGLVSWEHGAVRRPQIVPDHSACAELWEDTGILVPANEPYMYPETLTVGRIPSIDGVVQGLEEAYEDWRNGGEWLADMADRAYDKITSEEYDWKNISGQFDAIFRDIAKSEYGYND